MLAASVLAVVPTGGAGAQTVQQSSSSALVSTLGQPNTPSLSGNDFAQAFTTGSRASGYTLTSVDLLFWRTDDAALGSKLTVTVNEDSGGVPGGVVGTLTSPDIQTEPTAHIERTYRFAHAGAGLHLDAGTTYWAVFDLATTDSGINQIGRTALDGEDAGALAGFSIADTSLARVRTQTDWDAARDASSRTLRLGVNGHACPGSQAFSAAGVSVSHTGDGVPAAASAYAHTASGECAVLVEEGAQFTLSFTAGAPRYVRLDLS
ncbi:MAG: hypothetical protein OXK77_06185, partial [Gemmatimonadota bacterium]|nr:hypothetical protein [Gemmatimonadota bacterium]